MKKRICEKIKKRRHDLKYSANDTLEIINKIRKARKVEPIALSTYYKKEKGEIPIYVEELEDFAIALKVEVNFFYN